MSVTSFLCPRWTLKLNPPMEAALHEWAQSLDMLVAEDTSAAEWTDMIEHASQRGQRLPDLSGADWELNWWGEFGRRMHALLTVGTDCGCCHGWRVYAAVLVAQLPFLLLGLVNLVLDVTIKPGGLAAMLILWNVNLLVVLWLAGRSALRHKELTERE
jgi:hypothetical protein